MANEIAEGSNELPEHLQTVAKDELYETPETRDSALSNLKHLIENETSLELSADDPKFLLRFLRAAKFDVTKAFKRVQCYYKLRQQYKSDFENMIPSKMLPVMQSNSVGFLPERDQDGCKILYLHIGAWDPSKYDLTEMLNLICLCYERAIDEEVTQIAGMKVIVDDNYSFGWKHLKTFSPTLFLKMARALNGGLPIRMKGIHVVNPSSIFLIPYKTLRVFLTEKLRNRYIVHGDVKTLYEHIHPEYLPVNIGGKQAAFDNRECNEDLLKWEPTWREYLKYGYRE